MFHLTFNFNLFLVWVRLHRWVGILNFFAFYEARLAMTPGFFGTKLGWIFHFSKRTFYDRAFLVV